MLSYSNMADSQRQYKGAHPSEWLGGTVLAATLRLWYWS
jgi:hypothetical protein